MVINLRQLRLIKASAFIVVVSAAFSILAVNAEPFDLTNDFGGVGLLQTATARFADDGEFGVGISRVTPFNQLHIVAEPLPWLEGVFRYTNITNIPYNPGETNQHYKDRSFGVKARLLEEGENLPALAIGIQDLGGTGYFSGEYLVASRRYYDFDFSLGVGWGRPGAGGHLRNPLGLAFDHFDKSRDQPDFAGQTAGNVGLSRLFTGHTVGLFGGAQWKTPVPGLSIIIEYDGNDYQHEHFSNNLQQSSHVNVGVDYELFSGGHINLGYERGDTLTFGIELRTNFEKFPGIPKFLDPPPPPIGKRQSQPDSLSVPVITLSESQDAVDHLKTALADQKFSLVAVNFIPEHREIEVWVRQDRYRSPAKVIGRTARVLTGIAPKQIERFTVINLDQGVETYRATVFRKDFEKVASGQISADEILIDSEIVAPHPGAPKAEFSNLESYPKFVHDMGPGVRQQIGGPDGFYFGELVWRLDGGIKVNPNLSFTGQFKIDIVDNFSGLTQPSNSQLPHVRSDIVQYLRQGRNPLSELEADYIWSPATSVYARTSAGIFEDMYGGIAGELLYRPFDRRYAVGLDINYLKQRGFAERFDFRDYSIATGFVSLYYQFPIYDIIGKLSAGRYLAGDHGVTIDLARHFRSGVLVGAFATFTDVSAAQFGEGSFDKGIYIAFPLDLLLGQSGRNYGSFTFRPVTRDGGQRARDGIDLYGATSSDSLGVVRDGWPDVER